MHEMAVTQAMLELVFDKAGGRKITDIYLRVGRLSSVIPESINVYFDFLSKDTLAEGASLHFEIQPIEMTCRNCGKKTELIDGDNYTPQMIIGEAIKRGCDCGSKSLHVTGGVDFEVTSIDVE